MNSRPALLIFDFDGTIALGDGPVMAYARHAAAGLADPDRFVDGIRATLEDAEAGNAARDGVGTDAPLDGYDAVRRAAEAEGVAGDDLERAYRSSRALLGTESAPVLVPEGLADFLTEAGARGAERVLVTNAPDVRLREALTVLGLNAAFDRIVTDAGKPEGIDALLDTVPEGVRILSVGDIWHNDLAPAHRRGFATALVGGYDDPSADPTYRAATVTELLPHLLAWLREETSDPSIETVQPHTIEG